MHRPARGSRLQLSAGRGKWSKYTGERQHYDNHECAARHDASPQPTTVLPSLDLWRRTAIGGYLFACYTQTAALGRAAWTDVARPAADAPRVWRRKRKWRRGRRSTAARSRHSGGDIHCHGYSGSRIAFRTSDLFADREVRRVPALILAQPFGFGDCSAFHVRVRYNLADLLSLPYEAFYHCIRARCAARERIA